MIPIFIITCDRINCLKRSIESYNNTIETPFEVVIVDFGSTYKPLLEFLEHLEYARIKVYRMDKINEPNDLHMVNHCINDYFSTHEESNYVITDPDIALEDVKGDILDVASFMLSHFKAANVVGCMLRIDDIPDCYPYKSRIMDGTMGLHRMLHDKECLTIEYDGNEVHYVNAIIDSTFGMYRAGSTWVRCRHGIRITKPYEARHLDWYIDPENIPPDIVYYQEHAAELIAHWSRWNGQILPIRDKVTCEYA